MSEQSLCRRLVCCAVFLLAALSGLGARLSYLHLRDRRPAVETPATPHLAYKAKFAGQRGNICDRSGRSRILAIEVDRQHLCADPALLATNGQAAAVARRLAELLDLSAAELLPALQQPDKRYARLARYLDEPQVERVRAAKLPGLSFEDAKLRQYPHGAFMCHVLGFVNEERCGQAGVELYWDRYLRGSRGLIEGEANAVRQELYNRRSLWIVPLEGADLTLTLDQNVQYIVEKALDETMAEHRAKGAWAIVQRVRTGEILAMASRPAYDLNRYREAAANPSVMLNRAIGLVYEPGSTMKAIAFSAALNEGTVTPETRFDCEHGAWTYQGRVLRDYHPEGVLTVADGIKKSSNILTAKVALGLGPQRLYRYLRAFGVGERLGIDLPGEEAGILAPVSAWSGISITRIPIGQGVALTALQMLGVYCAIANDGRLMRPYTVARVTAPDGAVLYEQQPEALSQPISPATAATMRRLLARVTEEGGTGKRARIEGYEVAGKTGTAQKPVAGGYSATDYVASFVGFLPAEAPEIGVIVVVDEPQPFHTGGVVAGPAFKKIVSQAVRYLDIPPLDEESLARAD